MHNYRPLDRIKFELNDYCIIAIRWEDREKIRIWRNEQIEILRQNNELTKEDQDNYFKNIIAPLFTEEEPKQLLFSFLKNDKLVGYGGLVHISWEDKNAEISFLLETNRNKDIDVFTSEWYIYLSLIKEVAFISLRFKKIYTYGIDIRPHLTKVILKQNFVEEARLKDHVKKKDKYFDVLIHSFFIEQYT